MRNNSTSAAPTSTTKMTGFFISVTGFSFKHRILQRTPQNLRIEERARPDELLRNQARLVDGRRRDRSRRSAAEWLWWP